MGPLVKGDIVVLPFPFSNLSQSKRRPALVLAESPMGEAVMCMLTHTARNDEFTIPFTLADVRNERLGSDGFIRTCKLFTAHNSIVIYKAGELSSAKLDEVIENIIAYLTK